MVSVGIILLGVVLIMGVLLIWLVLEIRDLHIRKSNLEADVLLLKKKVLEQEDE
jgi:hypothetical protein